MQCQKTQTYLSSVPLSAIHGATRQQVGGTGLRRARLGGMFVPSFFPGSVALQDMCPGR